MSYSNSFGISHGSSFPSNMYSAQSTEALNLANAAAQLGQYTYQWAQGVYNADTAMTDQNVQSYLQDAQYGLALAQNQMGRYISMYEPEENTLAQLAGSYSSAAREEVNMGAAESAQEQAGTSALTNARQNLQSYGIDPSSGMYGELEEAQNAATGAAAAGGGQQAELATQATGRQLLGESIQVGEQLPGDTVNDINSSMAGIAGAENSVLANANTGVNLEDAANPYLQTAMALKYPPVGNTSSQGSTQMSNSQKPSSGGYGRQPASANSNGAPGSGGYSAKQPGLGNYGNENYGAIPNGGGTQNNGLGLGGTRSVPGGEVGPQVGDTVGNTDSFGNPVSSEFNGVTPEMMGSSAIPGAGTVDPMNSFPSFNGSQGFGGGSTLDNFSGPSNANTDVTGSFGGDSGITPVMPDMSQMGSGSGDYSFQGPPMSADSSTTTDTTTNNSGGDYGGYAGGGYAKGGAIPAQRMGGFRSNAVAHHGGGTFPQRTGAIPTPGRATGMPEGMPTGMTTGGKVPFSASPSQGRQTDDIPANLNAGEFVIPRDVAAWKGQEFFQKMIAQSRMARTKAPAKPSAKPGASPQGGPPRFVSRAVA